MPGLKRTRNDRVALQTDKAPIKRKRRSKPDSKDAPVSAALTRATRATRMEELRDCLSAQVHRMLDEGNTTGLAANVTALLKVESDLEEARAKEAREGATLDDSPAEVAGWLMRNFEEIERISRKPRGEL